MGPYGYDTLLYCENSRMKSNCTCQIPCLEGHLSTILKEWRDSSVDKMLVMEA